MFYIFIGFLFIIIFLLVLFVSGFVYCDCSTQYFEKANNIKRYPWDIDCIWDLIKHGWVGIGVVLGVLSVLYLIGWLIVFALDHFIL